MILSDKILQWYPSHKRDLPWRNTSDPYKIWLSEIILQQTRVNQGLPYYERFVQHFPTVQDLASASEQQVLQLWQGLGYYSRGRNLHASAKYITNELNGNFPSSYSEILKLKGVGEYTAAAIASFAYGEPVAVLDGNVMRVLTRFFGIDNDISQPSTVKQLRQLANAELPPKQSADYNQGIMEFGALQCTPKSPDCGNCPLQGHCAAFYEDKVDQLPVKLKKTKVKDRFFTYFVFDTGDALFLRQRTGKDVWHKLHDFPLQEDKRLLTTEEVRPHLRDYVKENEITSLSVSEDVKHQLSHQRIHARFFHIELKQDTTPLGDHLLMLRKNELNDYGKPILIENYLREYIF